MVLQDITIPTIEHDIEAFLKGAFSTIRAEFNSQNMAQISQDWPGDEKIERLAKMVVPLFIFAATICRFVGDTADWDPQGRLANILEDKALLGASQLDQTYLPVLKRLETQQSRPQFKKFCGDFRLIIGSIVLDIDAKLHNLHSVLSVPSDSSLPVRLLHLSFREFLIDSEKDINNHWFRIDEEQTHGMVSARCLEILSESLKENMCSMGYPGMKRSEVDPTKIEGFFPSHFRYGCLYWVHHFVHSGKRIHDNDAVHSFLRKHLLHWFEALSLLRGINHSIKFIDTFCSLAEERRGREALNFLRDAKRFILQNWWIINEAPLQIYSSALIFSPQKSIVRVKFQSCIPKWIRRLPKTAQSWGAELQKLEAHMRSGMNLIFLPDGRLVSASKDGTIAFWDIVTGEKLKIFEPIYDHTPIMAISTDGLIAQALTGGSIVIWDIETNEIIRKLGRDDGQVVNLGFMAIGLLASTTESSAKTVKVWDIVTGDILKEFEHDEPVSALGFSSGEQLASGLRDGRICIWDTVSGENTMVLKGRPSDRVDILIFSPKTNLASVSLYLVKIWDLMTGYQIKELEEKEVILSVCFTSNGDLVSSLRNGTINIWNAVEGELLKSLKGYKEVIVSVAFSFTDMKLASASLEGIIRLWDPAEDSEALEAKINRNSGYIGLLRVSPDLKYIAIDLGRDGIQIWDTATLEKTKSLEIGVPLESIAFSPDGKWLAFTKSTSSRYYADTGI
ncbi:hypothetical protein TWF106_004299 [Orbilia oligospora]|uniref:Uncharacterized protein n=1 Tax=Orbilia oligospora TaxID=2813651 RepID=A0A7C8UWH6_ORBOL|nr:hypothetical protein TWF106_004299 [Orbilia oligospora]